MKNKLLLIDDDPNLVLLIADYLEYQNYQVTTAENGQEALRELEKQIPDTIVCDILMPEMDGYTFVETLQQDPRTRWIPVIFLSAKGQSQDKVKGLNAGADVYMIKPFEPVELLAQIKACITRGSQSRPIISNKALEFFHPVKLTRTEIEVLKLVSVGTPNKNIAATLNVSPRTIESHLSNLLRKTSFHNRTELARWALETNYAA